MLKITTTSQGKSYQFEMKNRSDLVKIKKDIAERKKACENCEAATPIPSKEENNFEEETKQQKKVEKKAEKVPKAQEDEKVGRVVAQKDRTAINVTPSPATPTTEEEEEDVKESVTMAMSGTIVYFYDQGLQPFPSDAIDSNTALVIAQVANGWFQSEIERHFGSFSPTFSMDATFTSETVSNPKPVSFLGMSAQIYDNRFLLNFTGSIVYPSSAPLLETYIKTFRNFGFYSLLSRTNATINPGCRPLYPFKD